VRTGSTLGTFPGAALRDGALVVSLPERFSAAVLAVDPVP
jgi:hypothetical protein